MKILLISLLFLISLSNSAYASPAKVATTFTIIQDIASNIAGDKIDIISITKAGSEIHDYEPTPQDIVRTTSASLVLWNGLGLERWFERFFVTLGNIQSAVVTDGITIKSITEGEYQGKPNPHAWMSPKNGIIYVENIKKSLIKLDPSNRKTFEDNALKYSNEIQKIDEYLKSRLSLIPKDHRWLVTSEGAFRYMTDDYGLKELFLWPINADQEGTPLQIKKVIDTVRLYKIPVVFSESTISDKPIKQVALETGAKYGGALYVDSLTDPEGSASTYLKLLTYNTELILNGFGVK